MQNRDPGAGYRTVVMLYIMARQLQPGAFLRRVHEEMLG